GASPAPGERRAAAGPARRPPAESFYLAWHREGKVAPVTIIVPIHDAHDAVAECLASLRRHLPQGAEVLMIDDASRDPRIVDLLRHYRDDAGFRLHRNGENLGYTGTVNLGISLCPGRDVVLLNSDTVVTA